MHTKTTNLHTVFLWNFLLLSGDTQSSVTSTGGLGVLTSDLQAPEMSKTSVTSDLLESFEIFSELSIQSVGSQLRVSTILEILLSVQEPLGDTVADGVSDDFGNLGHFFFRKITGSSVDIELGLLADEEGESSTDTLNASDGEGDLSFTFDVGVEDTENVFEFSSSFVN